MTKRKVVQPDLIDLLLADYKKPEDLLGEGGCPRFCVIGISFNAAACALQT